MFVAVTPKHLTGENMIREELLKLRKEDGPEDLEMLAQVLGFSLFDVETEAMILHEEKHGKIYRGKKRDMLMWYPKD